jgi:hypothetical protein
MNEKYMVYICDYLDALPSNAQSLLVNWYQIEELTHMIKNNEKCLIVYPPYEVNNNEK